MGNYRPVSSTSVVGKVLETLIEELRGKHLNKYKLSKGSHHRFTKERSCFSQFLTGWMQESQWTCCICRVAIKSGNIDNIVILLQFEDVLDER